MPTRHDQSFELPVDFENRPKPHSFQQDSFAYRPFIDGLRAIAVTSVVASHVGIPGFHGGFIGVDIFFVISGFLIIGQILHDLKAGTFSFAKFWAKRTLRIIPPLLAMMLVCCVIAPFVFVSPSQFREFGNEVVYSASMLVNYYFLYKQDYFDSEAILKPLLHVWSLAVEEQFYLLAPLALYGLWKTRSFTGTLKTLTFPTLAVAAFIVSLGACFLFTQPEKNYAFYVMLCRAWEFIAGGAIIYFAPKFTNLPKLTLHAIAAAGLLAILASVVLFNEALPFPSYYAILPVAGTAMVIVSGVANPRLAAIRILAMPPLVAVGLISYGWYLWHWPLLSFVRIYNFGTTDLTRDLSAVLLGLGVAIISYFAIERPTLRLRRMKLRSRTWSYVVGAVLAAAAVASVAGIAYISAIATKAELAIPLGLRVEKDTKVMVGDPCWMFDPGDLSPTCLEKIGNKKVVVLIGDSHARMLYQTLKSQTSQSGMELVSLWRSGCSPFDIEQITSPVTKSPKCLGYTERGIATLKQKLASPPVIVVLGGYWPKFVHGESYSEFVRGKGVDGFNGDRSGELVAALSRIQTTLQQAGVSKTLLMGPTAELLYSPLDCVLRSQQRQLGAEFCNVPAEKMREWLKPANTALQRAAASFPNTVVINASEALCDEISCKAQAGGKLLYPDTHHTSRAGADRLFERTTLNQYFK